MTRERFERIVAEVLDDLPPAFAERMTNIVVLVEDYPPEQRPPRVPRPRRSSTRRTRSLLMGVFVGTPRTQKSVFDQPLGPDHIVLYQKNIEAVCRTERELRREIRLTVMHELGHYFGLSEGELSDV